MSALQNLRVVEGIAMEKSWENFWTTGKVEDYLTYRNVNGLEKDERVDGTVSSFDGNGAFHHADFGLRQKNNGFDQRTR